MTVSQSMKKINRKIPGILPPPPKTEIDGKIENLSSKNISELLELKERQTKLLSNKAFINKLPDKGDKLSKFLDKIVTELEAKRNEEQTCRLFGNMQLTSGIDKKTLQNVEWEGELKNNQNTYLDSDDDSEPEDTLHILSKSTAQEKKIKVIKPETPLITPEDLLSFKDTPHIKYIVEKTENNIKAKSVNNFKPYKTTASNVHDPVKEMLRKRHKYWEITAATPPPITHGPAKVLNLEESLVLQKEYNSHLKIIEAQHAAEKLFARTGIKMAELPVDTTQFGTYRSADTDDSGSEDSDPEGSDHDVHDEEPDTGGVVFTVMK